MVLMHDCGPNSHFFSFENGPFSFNALSGQTTRMTSYLYICLRLSGYQADCRKWKTKLLFDLIGHIESGTKKQYQKKSPKTKRKKKMLS